MKQFVMPAIEKDTKDITIDLDDSRVLDFDNPDHRMYMFKKHSRNEQPVYVYSTMDGDADITFDLVREYARLLEDGEKPCVGRWTDETGTHLDASLVVDDGMDDAGIRQILDMYEQRYAVKLTARLENGNIASVEKELIDREP